MTPTEIERIMTKTLERVGPKIAEDAAVRALERYGVDAQNPAEMQRDMAHLRKWRVSVEGAQRMGFWAMTGTLATGLLGALWLGIQQLFNPQG